MSDLLGLTAVEESLYLLLLDAPSLTVAELADLSGGTQEGAGVVLGRLQAHGLVSPLAGTPVRYAAIDPRVGLKGLVAAQEQRLRHAEAAARQLIMRFDGARRGRNPLDVVEVAIGEQPILDRFEEMQAGAQAEIIGLVRPPYFLDGLNEDQLRHQARGVVYRSLYDASCLDDAPTLAEVRQLQQAGEQARVLAGVPFKLIVADRELALLALTGGPDTRASCLLVHPSALLDGLVGTFETLWRHAGTLPEPSGSGSVAPTAEGSPTPVERELLALTGLGLTDKAIGRQLGMSERSVQRMMSALMARLSARTRFQAGLRAKELGWL